MVQGESSPPQPGSPSRTPALVVAGRLILLLLAAAAMVSGFALSRARDRSVTSSGELYVCPMHPEVTSSRPQECPICRMALEPFGVPGSDAASGTDGESASLEEHKVVDRAKRRVFALEARAPAWVEAEGRVAAVVYNDQRTALAPGDHALFHRAAAPTVGIRVRLTGEPPSPWDGSTSRVRFRLQGGAPRLEPGAVGWVTLPARPREHLVVPSSAVLPSPQGPYVLVAGPDGRTFSRRHVEVGKVYAGLAVVLSGLKEEEQVVVGSAFFVDAEQRLQSLRAGSAGGTQ